MRVSVLGVLPAAIIVLACASPSAPNALIPLRKAAKPVRNQAPGPQLPSERVDAGYAEAGRGSNVPEFWVRPGYRVSIVAENFGNARFMQFDDHGHLFVSQPEKGTIAILKKAGNRYETTGEFVQGYRSVHGLDFKDGYLWFTTSGAVYRAKVGADGTAGTVETILKDLPNGGHWWRSIFVVEDGFFTSIGDSGNINDLTNSDREKIWKYSLDGKNRKLWSAGIRNTEKLRYKPGTTDLYGADHGSDDFGKKLGERQGVNQPVTDENPPCEFNLYLEGGFYGHPFVVGNNIPRYEYMDRPDILDIVSKSIPPIWSLGPHWAPNGWTFLTNSKLGSDFNGDALIAMHGSWNRVKKSGYSVNRILFDHVTGKPFGSQLLVSTLGKSDETLGRPVDVVQAPDGAVLFTDDQTNRIYQLDPVK